MPSTRIWTPNAVPTPQITLLSFTGIVPGDVVTVTLNNKSVSYTSLDGTAGDMASGLMNAWNSSAFAEMRAVTPALAYTLAGNTNTPVIGLNFSSPTPFTLSATITGHGATPSITVLETQVASSSAQDGIQSIIIPAATGGTYTLTYGAQTTTAIAYNAGAATVQAALQALSSIGSGNCTVTGFGTVSSPFLVTFTGALAGTAVTAITANAGSLSGTATAYVQRVTAGSSSTSGNEVLRFSLNFPSGTQIAYTFPPLSLSFQQAAIASTYPFQPLAAANANDFQNYLNSWYNVSNGAQLLSPQNGVNFQVDQFFYGGYADVELVGEFAGGSYPAFTANNSLVFHPTNTTTLFELNGVITGDAQGQPPVQIIKLPVQGGTNEVQNVVISGATGGTFTLSVTAASSTHTTAAIAYNASASAVQSALEALSNIGVGQVSVAAGTAADGVTPCYAVTFTGTLADTSIPLMVVNGQALTGGGTITIATVQPGSSTHVNQVIVVTLNNASGGTWDISSDGQTTSPLAWNISAASLQSAINTSLTTILVGGTGSVVVTGADGGPFTITFSGGAAAGQEIYNPYPQFVAGWIFDASSLTGTATETISATTTQAATGPNFWSDANNWRDASNATGLPVTGDDVYFQDSDVDVLYGLDQHTVVLNSLNVDSSYTGSIGLAHFNPAGYVEWNPQYLQIGATNVELGRGNGNGSNLIKLDNGTNQVTLRIDNSGTSADDLPAIQWKGTHASNAVYLSKGDFGAAVYANETATIAEFEVSWKTNQNSDATFVLGDGCTTTTIKKVGGQGAVYGPTTNIVNRAGDLTVVSRSAGNIASLVHDDGVFSYQGVGIIALADVSGVIDFRQDLRPRTITTLNLYKGAEYHDPEGTVTVTNPIKFVQTNPGPDGVVFDVPQNITITMTVL